MRHRRRVDLCPAGVLDRDQQTGVDGDIADQASLGDSSDAGEFDGDAVDKMVAEKEKEVLTV